MRRYENWMGRGFIMMIMIFYDLSVKIITIIINPRPIQFSHFSHFSHFHIHLFHTLQYLIKTYPINI